MRSAASWSGAARRPASPGSTGSSTPSTSRNSGRPTSSPDALDGDCILAATALLAAAPGDVLTVATLNVGHLAQFVDARPCEKIAP